MNGSTPPAGRTTRQRIEVTALLQEVNDFLTAQQLHGILRERGAKVGLTTVYRTLQRLVEIGEIDATRAPDGEQLFRQCSRSRHHHHLVCRMCGRTVEIEGPAMERWTEKVAGQHGYSDIAHTLEIFGTCSACAR